MQNAALYFHPDGFDTTTGRLLGRHSAGESFLRGFVRHAEIDELALWNVAGKPQSDLEALLRRVAEPQTPVRWIAATNRAGLKAIGLLNLPGPAIGDEAWRRRVVGSRGYAICGITHTTATARVMGMLADLLVAPTEGYDALICTSSAVRASVEAQLDCARAYLAQEYGPRRRAEPQRVTIPLGINTEDYAHDPAQRTAWRERLGIPSDAAVALYVGRFNVREKMNPALMAIALERAAKALERPIWWINSGWAESAEEAAAYHAQTRALCPSVHYVELDGRQPDVRFSIWSAADFFISFSDNIQETFGLTPIEAMAAGLPCVVTDWNGYKDTVRHGIDGFRVPTLAPRPGLGGDLAFAHANDWLNYTNYVGATAQFTAIDYAAAVEAISALVLNADLRRTMGAQARAQGRVVFDWAAIIPQYQALWADQDARRRAAAPDSTPRDYALRPDPLTLFGGYPTRHLALDDGLTLTPGATWPEAAVLLQSDLARYSRFNRPSDAETEQMVAWVAAHPGSPVRALLDTFPEGRRNFIQRGVLWIARYGVIVVTPAS